MLKLKHIGIDTYNENVALIARDCSDFRPAEYQAFKKVRISDNGSRQILASLAIVDDSSILRADEIGLTEKAFRRFGLAEGRAVSISPASPPASLDAVRAKIQGQTLSDAEIRSVIADIAEHRYSDMEIAAFLIASASFLTTDEMLSLTWAMAGVGTRLKWPMPVVADKHCIGGLPGNRTSMVVVPIVAAHGLPIPKTSSRAITSPAGTADAMEVLARVDLTAAEMQEVVRQCNGCLVWGGHVNLSPADDILIAVERPLNVDTREQMVASIMSKKLAAGSTHLLIDIPVGRSAKVRSSADAMRLRKLFEYIGDKIGLQLDIHISEGHEPVGRGIGPALEAADVMAVLERSASAPKDLEEKSLRLAGRLLEFDPQLRGGAGYARARELLASGAALGAMQRIIAAQGPNPAPPCVGPLIHDVLAPADGKVAEIDCQRLSRIARLAGAPMDKGAGILLAKKTGDAVQQGEPLYRIHACEAFDFGFARKFAADDTGYRIQTGNGVHAV